MKVNFKALLVSLMSVAILAGCGSANVEDISVVPLEVAVVGETIDLKDYVTVEGDTDKFSAKLITTDTAKLEGTKLKLLREGDVTVYITAGDKEAVLTFSAISKIKNSYRDYSKDIQDKFFIGTVENNVFSTDGWIFNEEYSAFDYSFYGEEGYEGYLYSGSDVYCVTMDDREGTNAKLQLGTYSSQYYAPVTFDLNYSLFKTELYSLTEYCLKGDEDVFADFCSLISLNSGAFKTVLENQGLEYLETKLVVRMVEKSKNGGTEKESIPVFSFEVSYKNGGKKYVEDSGYYFYLSKDPDLYTIPVLQDMIDDGAKPEQPELNDLYGKANEIVTAKNYTLNVDMRWYRWNKIDEKTKEKVTTDTPVLAGTDSNTMAWNSVLQDLSRESKQVAYVTENAALFKETENRRFPSINGRYDYYYEREGKLLKSSNYTELGDSITLTEASEKEVAGQDKVWNNAKSLGLIDAFSTNSTARKNANVIYMKSDGDSAEYDYVFNGANAGGDFFESVLSLAHFYGNELVSSYVGSFVNITGFELLLMRTYTYIKEDSLKFEMTFAWDSDHIFEMVYEFTNIGTTTIPSL